MGCDIHIVIERLDDGVWREVPYRRIRTAAPPPTNAAVATAPECFTMRNYDLFGILADVRNGVGFAGVRMGDGWPSIAPDRGLPDGFSVKAVAPDPNRPDDGPRWLGDHSFTWVSLDELKAFPWDAIVTTLYGVVSAADYERLSAVGDAPTEYSGGIVGRDIAVYDPTAYAKARETGTLVKEPYVRMCWPESARGATGDWPGPVIPWLTQLSDGRPLRLILGFDS